MPCGADAPLSPSTRTEMARTSGDAVPSVVTYGRIGTAWTPVPVRIGDTGIENVTRGDDVDDDDDDDDDDDVSAAEVRRSCDGSGVPETVTENDGGTLVAERSNGAAAGASVESAGTSSAAGVDE